MADLRANPVLSDERIDEAPEAIRALFREYETMAVCQALTMVGINDDPALFTEAQIAEAVEAARLILKANDRLVTERLLNGPR